MTVKYVVQRFLKYSENVQINKIKLVWMYILDFLRFKCTIKDFFNYKFYLLNSNGKKMFATGGQLKVMFEKINQYEYAEHLISKEKTFLKYGKYMNRMWCGIKYNNTLEDYEAFIASNKLCVLKPLDQCGGYGVELLELKGEKPYTAKRLRAECIEKNAIIEELIPQHEQMKILNDSSVNSIRVITVGDKIIGAVLRIGGKGSFVDNACSGGIFAEVDVETGIVVSSAVNYSGNDFLIHPDTKAQIIGFKVPMWNECVKTVSEATGILPQIPIKGFDVAITPNGPVFIEVNDSPDFAILQHPRALKFKKCVLNVRKIINKNKKVK